MEGSPETWRLLGELFVERGLITGDELAGALDEQSRTGCRLGTILISRGIVSEPELTSALVEQIGIDGLVEELEIAAAEVDAGRGERRRFLSWRTRGSDDKAGDDAEPAEPASLASDLLDSVLDEPPVRKSGGRGPLGWLASMRQSLDDAEAEANRLTGKLAGAAKALSDERDRAAEREAMLDRETERREAAELEIQSLRTRVADQSQALSRLEARAGDLAARIAAATTELETEKAAREHAEQAHAQVAAQLEAHEAEAGRLIRQLDGLIGNVQALRADHDLIERTGSPPAVGDELPLGDRRFAVERIGRSPLPFDRRPCVQLRVLAD
jgi:hypothetical protein